MHTAFEMAPRAPAISSESEGSITLRCQLCSIRYTAIQIKSCFKNTSAMEVATMKNTDDFLQQREASHHVLPPNRHFSLSVKMNGTQRRTLVSPLVMHRYHFFTTDPIPIHLRPEMADTDPIPILCPTGISHKKQLVI